MTEQLSGLKNSAPSSMFCFRKYKLVSRHWNVVYFMSSYVNLVWLLDLPSFINVINLSVYRVFC
jgi:hypothetical protein